MTAKPYLITGDAARKLITISFDAVFWQVDVSSDFIRDCVGAVAALGCDPRQHRILVDLRNAVLQSKDTYDRMLALVASATAYRIALVAAAPLARMQTKRLQIRPDVVMFDTLPAAETWLFEDERMLAAAG